MDRRIVYGIGGIIAFLMPCQSPHARRAETPRSIAEYQARAKKFGADLQLPVFETTPESVRHSMSNALARGNAELDRIGSLNRSQVTFDNTIRALDDLTYDVLTTANRIYLLKETSENAAVRDAGTEMIKWYEEWTVSLDYREDVYAAVRAFSDTKPRLQGEDKKLFEEILRDYRRAGLHLNKSERTEVEQLRKKLTGLTTDFDANITKVQKPVVFSLEELESVPESFLNQPKIKTGDNQYTIMANVTFHFVTVMENAKREATRRRLKTERYSLATDQNSPLLQQIVELRDEIARKLGYPTWADYQIEVKMAKTARRAREFVQELSAKLQPKFDQELAEFRRLKVEETGNSNARIELWDWRYYSNELKKRKYDVDAEQLRVYFPYQRVLEGMFDIYERLFQLRVSELDAPYKWTESLKLYVVEDARSGEPLGALYMDMFPREGKYNHFAQFGIIEGKLRRDGQYQRPVAALICNFPPPQANQPSLLSHNEVETLFHEFGHALHTIMTRAHYARFSGTSVPRDFVEAPSQMLENWVWDKKMLDGFAGDYRNPTKKIPDQILSKLKEAKLATVATFYRRQLSMAMLDLALHTEVRSGSGTNVIDLSNRMLNEHFLPVPEGTAMAAYFGHLTGYDAGYYGYAWADAIAADMATVFEQSKRGYFDETIGLRLRNEIYAPGGSRDAEISIRRFLGREQSLDAFLETLGMRP